MVHPVAVLNGGDHRFRDIVASALGWWAEAGVDTLVSDDIRDWLTAPARPGVDPTRAGAGPVFQGRTDLKAPPEALTPTELPGTLPALLDFLATGEYGPKPAPSRSRVAPVGDPGSELMIITDMPDAGDERSGLFSGETASLYDAMLKAMGFDRTGVYCAPLSPARSPGRIDGPQGDALTRLMRRHLSFAKPKALILFGDETTKALLGPDALTPRGGLRLVNHDGGEVSSIALSHPRTLRRSAAARAAAWKDMRLLIGVLAR